MPEADRVGARQLRTDGRRPYLRVATDNDPALRLYARAGFHELVSYHYRSADTRADGGVT